jgi:hypothetical protein
VALGLPQPLVAVAVDTDTVVAAGPQALVELGRGAVPVDTFGAAGRP